MTRSLLPLCLGLALPLAASAQLAPSSEAPPAREQRPPREGPERRPGKKRPLRFHGFALDADRSYLSDLMLALSPRKKPQPEAPQASPADPEVPEAGRGKKPRRPKGPKRGFLLLDGERYRLAEIQIEPLGEGPEDLSDLTQPGNLAPSPEGRRARAKFQAKLLRGKRPRGDEEASQPEAAGTLSGTLFVQTGSGPKGPAKRPGRRTLVIEGEVTVGSSSLRLVLQGHPPRRGRKRRPSGPGSQAGTPESGPPVPGWFDAP